MRRPSGVRLQWNLLICVIACCALAGPLRGDCSVSPTVSATFSAPDVNGKGTVSITYSFPDTTSQSQRRLTFSGTKPNGYSYVNSTSPAAASGVWQFDFHTSCWNSGTYNFTATASSCDLTARTVKTIVPIVITEDAIPPTVAVSHTGPDAEGNGTYRIDYSFPRTYSDQRQLIARLLPPGVGGGTVLPTPAPTGSYETNYSLTCKSGTYILRADAEACFTANKASAEETIFLDATPVLTMDIAQPDDAGKVDVTLGWAFKYTAATTDRKIQRSYVTPAGNISYDARSGQPKEGALTFTHNVSCWPAGTWKIDGLASTCNGTKSATGTVTTRADPPSVDVTLRNLGFDEGQQKYEIEGRINYDMQRASGSWQLRADRMRFVANDGTSYAAAGLVAPFVPATRTGTHVFKFYLPAGAQQVLVRATASSCYGAATGEATIDCPDCPGAPAASAEPVYFNDGNMRLSDTDPLPPVAGSALVRTYNSHEQTSGLFGTGWTTPFDRRITVHAETNGETVAVSTEQNELHVFRRSGSGPFAQTFPTARWAHGTLTYDAALAVYVHRPAASSTAAVFRASDGRLTAFRDIGTGREAQITRDAAGQPVSFTDSWTATSWNFTLDSQRRVTAIEVSGRPDLRWTYSYDAGGKLTAVLAPGNATWRTYEYASNRITASRDAVGNLIESHVYDARGRAITSTGQIDEIANVEYGIATARADETITRVTMNNGAVTDYVLRPIGGAWRTVRVIDGCGSCGARDATYAYDARGRVIRTQGADGYISRSVYAGDRLTQEEGPLKPAGCDPQVSATQCRLGPDELAAATLHQTADTVLTEYVYGSTNWPDRPTKVTTPSVAAPGMRREQTVTYDAESGVVIGTSTKGYTGFEPAQIDLGTTTVLYRATSREGDDGVVNGLAPAFDPGGAFDSAWLSLPQPVLLPKSVDGPRNDVADVTAYVYYPIAASVPALLRGRLAAVRNAAGHVTRFESYDVFGNVTRSVDSNGIVTEPTFDLLGRPKTTTIRGIPGCDTSVDALCATDLTTTRSYSPAAGPLSSETRPGGGVTAYTYDERGRVRTVSRGPSGSDLREAIEYSYDLGTGKKSSERYLALENGVWTEKRSETYSYNTVGELNAVTHADGTSVAYTYDASGRIKTARDENHTAANTTYAYDADGHLASVTQTLAGAPNGRIATRYGYDLHGNLTGVTDPNGNVTRYFYDDFGALLAQESPVTGRTEYEYDEGLNQKRTVDARGVITRYTYDVLNRRTRAESGAATTTPGDDGGGGRIEAVAASVTTETITWTYDDPASSFGIGRLTSMNDPTGVTTYGYERRGALASETKTVDGTAFETAFGYDADGNRSRIRYPSGRVVTYAFDFAGRPLSALLGTTPLVSAVTYLPFGPATSMSFGNGTTRRMPHDTRYRPLQNDLTTAERTLASYNYAHDAAGNVTRIDDMADPTFTRTFAYDDLNRLKSATGVWGSASYAYDRMGNMLNSSRGEATTAFAYRGTTPQLASITANGRESQAVEYDANGNEILTGTTAYAYSARNHLAAAGATTTYAYDGRGIRTVSSRVVRIASFVVHPTTVQGGGSATLVVTLTAPAPAAGAVIALTSSAAFAPVPPSISISGGAVTATYTIQTQVVTGEQTAVLTAAFNGFTNSASLTVVGSRFDELAVQPSSVVGGSDATGTVSLSQPAPEEGLSVDLSSSDAETARVPSRLTIPGGERRGQFRVATTPVRAATNVTIGASVGERDKTATVLTIVPPSLALVSFNPPALFGGNAGQGTVTLNGPAPVGGVAFSVRANSALITMPEEVVVPAGATTASFNVTAVPVETPQTVSIRFISGESERTATLRIDPPLLTDFKVAPGRIEGGNERATAEATLNAPAAAEGATVEITSTHPAIIAPPAAFAVPSEQTTRSTSLPTNAVAEPTPVVLSATRNGVTRSSTVVVEPPAVTLAAFSIAPESLTGSNDGVATVTLTAPAPAAGVEIELTSSAPVVTVPPAITVPSGLTRMTFAFSTSVVNAATTVTVAATHAVTTKTAGIAVLPPVGNYVSAVVVSPVFATSGTATTGTVSLATSSNEPSGTDVLLVSSDPSVVSLPSRVTVNRHAASESFPIAVGAVATSSRVAITASYGGVVQRTTLVVAPVNTVVPSSLTVSPDRVTGGTPTSAVVTLSGPAPVGGALVTLAARRRNMVSMPNSVMIPEGATTATFGIATETVHGRARVTEIDATYNGITVTTTLTVDPAQRAASDPRKVALCASVALEPCLTRDMLEAVASSSNRLDPVASSTLLYEKQLTLYSPELSLLAETIPTTGQTHTIGYEYVWFAGQPLAQVNSTTGAVDWYFNDHLGTPILQTDATARIVWRAEYEPYGEVHAFRRGEAKHQPLRFPGQTAEEGTGLSYNIFRWYRSGWGRYTQADPISFIDNAAVPVARLQVGAVLHWYDYAAGQPTRLIDPLGLWGIAPPNPHINTIVCDGNGGVIPQIASRNRCWNGCSLAHEYSHIADVMAAQPTICQGQPRGVIPGFTSLNEEIESERRAYQVTIDCLNERLAAGANNNGCCDADLRSQLQNVTEYAQRRGYLP